MKNKLKVAVAAFGIALSGVSATSTAVLDPKLDYLQACIDESVRVYCKQTGQGSSCTVPINIYNQIRFNCT